MLEDADDEQVQGAEISILPPVGTGDDTDGAVQLFIQKHLGSHMLLRLLGTF